MIITRRATHLRYLQAVLFVALALLAVIIMSESYLLQPDCSAKNSSVRIFIIIPKQLDLKGSEFCSSCFWRTVMSPVPAFPGRCTYTAPHGHGLPPRRQPGALQCSAFPFFSFTSSLSLAIHDAARRCGRNTPAVAPSHTHPNLRSTSPLLPD